MLSLSVLGMTRQASWVESKPYYRGLRDSMAHEAHYATNFFFVGAM